VLSCTSKHQLSRLLENGILPDHLHNRADRRIFRIVGRKEIYRRSGPRGILFVSIASAADSFRSTCGPERGAPECSTQRFPAGTPHVGQGTEDNCLGVRSLFLIWIRCAKTSRKTVPFRTICEPPIANCRFYRTTVGNRAYHHLMGSHLINGGCPMFS
jgi:hypothetical protein